MKHLLEASLQVPRALLLGTLRTMAKLMRLLTFGRLKYSRSVEGNALYMSLGEKLWYGYKFYGNPIREPERGKNIREHFLNNPPEGFWDANASLGANTLHGANATNASHGANAVSCNEVSRASVSNGANAANTSNAAPKGLPSITIAFAGDILPCPDFPQTPSGHLIEVINFFKTADIRCANLESPVLASKPICIPPEDILAPPDMNNSPEAIKYLLQGVSDGITIFSTANNHAMDQGVEGVVATLDFLDELGVLHVGTARSSTERDALLIVEKRPCAGNFVARCEDSSPFRIAFLSWTFSLNCHSLPVDQEYLANTLRLNLPGVDISPIAAQVREARRRGAEAVVLFLHWGLEDESFPLASQIDTAHRLAECGVDIICGNHPHALQPAERYVWQEKNSTDGFLRESLIIYALGDFLTPQPHLGMSAISATMEVTLVRRILQPLHSNESFPRSDGRVVIYDVKTKQYDRSE